MFAAGLFAALLLAGEGVLRLVDALPPDLVEEPLLAAAGAAAGLPLAPEPLLHCTSCRGDTLAAVAALLVGAALLSGAALLVGAAAAGALLLGAALLLPGRATLPGLTDPARVAFAASAAASRLLYRAAVSVLFLPATELIPGECTPSPAAAAGTDLGAAAAAAVVGVALLAYTVCRDLLQEGDVKRCLCAVSSHNASRVLYVAAASDLLGLEAPTGVLVTPAQSAPRAARLRF